VSEKSVTRLDAACPRETLPATPFALESGDDLAHFERCSRLAEALMFEQDHRAKADLAFHLAIAFRIDETKVRDEINAWCAARL